LGVVLWWGVVVLVVRQCCVPLCGSFGLAASRAGWKLNAFPCNNADGEDEDDGWRHQAYPQGKGQENCWQGAWDMGQLSWLRAQGPY